MICKQQVKPLYPVTTTRIFPETTNPDDANYRVSADFRVTFGQSAIIISDGQCFVHSHICRQQPEPTFEHDFLNQQANRSGRTNSVLAT
jgi:hypothetical protein